MNPFQNFDPSTMDPQMLADLTALVQNLPPEQLSRMQTLMHNMMAGFDVTREMEDFERSLPPDFRIKLAGIMASKAARPVQEQCCNNVRVEPKAPDSEPDSASTSASIKDARMTVLRAVADGKMTPEDAEKLLF